MGCKMVKKLLFCAALSLASVTCASFVPHEMFVLNGEDLQEDVANSVPADLSTEQNIEQQGVADQLLETDKVKAGWNTGAITLRKVTYTRYGSFSCPQDERTSTVYTGYAVGTHYTHAGGGLGPLCLSDPNQLALEYLDHQPGYQNLGLLYGSEYETWYFRVLNNVHDFDIPCTVCLASGRTRELMIPGRTSCPSGWTLEYKGYLMSNHHTHHSPGDFVCMDEEADFFRKTRTNYNGQLFYGVEIASDSALCRDYECSGKEIACAVCTR